MSQNIVCGLFPGQGSQAIGMGKAWYDSSDTAKELFQKADKALGFEISKLCFDGPIEELTLTKHTQPALLLVSYLNYLMADIPVHTVAGHSLGEYTALVAASVISFEDALQLVYKRGKYMQEAVPVGTGAMIAVMGPSEEEIVKLISEKADGIVEIANLNSPGQTVLAGEKLAVEKFSSVLAENSAKVIPLNVSAPFHCSLMKEAEIALTKDLDATTFNDPKIKVYANYTAKEITTGADARELLKKQVCGTVRWTELVTRMLSETNSKTTIEFGPGGILTKLLKRTVPDTKRFEVSDPANLAKTLEALKA